MDVHDKWGEKMSDLIRRSDAIEAVWSPQVRPNELIFDALKRAIESEINNLPSADRPRGEWIEQEDDYHHYWECSECGMGVGLDDIRNFCPNCGAHMKGADDE